MKKIRKRDLKKVNALVNEHNARIAHMKRSVISKVEPDFVTGLVLEAVDSAMSSLYMRNPISYDVDCVYIGKTMDDITSEADGKLKKAYSVIDTLLTNLLFYTEQCHKNKEELHRLYESGVPLFIVVEPMSIGGVTSSLLNPSGKNSYCFCYEFKDTEVDGIYLANLMESRYATSFNRKIDYREVTVRPMTEFEFEHQYIMNRLNCVTFKSEEELVEFDNSIRRLFHGQRNII